MIMFYGKMDVNNYYILQNYQVRGSKLSHKFGVWLYGHVFMESTEANLGCVKTSSVYSVLASSVTVEVKSSGVYSVLCSPSQ